MASLLPQLTTNASKEGQMQFKKKQLGGQNAFKWPEYPRGYNLSGKVRNRSLETIFAFADPH
jgi:hypothetical protein